MPEKISALCAPKRFLMGAGPSMVDPRVYEGMAQPIVSHLDPFLFQVTEDIRKHLAVAFGTKNEFTLAISGTGTAGMETSITNFVSPSDKFLVFANGYFCDRICEIGRRQGANVVRFDKPWGEVASDEEARAAILRERPQVVAYVQAETSTGVFQKGKALCEAAHEVGALVIADVVTSLGCMPVEIDKTGIDIGFSCVQKGLACPPGLSPVTLSARALEILRARENDIRTFYFDLKLLDEYYKGGHRYHHTAPITMFYALREGLAVIAEEGIENRWERHRLGHRALVAGLEAMGLVMHVSDPAIRLPMLNTVRVPEGIDGTAVRARLRDEFSIEISGGFGDLASKIFRIGIMGVPAQRENILRLLEGLEVSLRAEGYATHASGTEAAEKVYAGV
jgi:alanine-glyoxylate transaminase/serine-glyoxylate transaminase/serine-pyruvate transaminase